MPDIRFPDDSKRHVIVGSTGSGKSQNGAFHLAHRSFTSMPWFVFNPKGDELLNSCGMTDFDFTSKKIPTKPGLYNFMPVPGSDDEDVERFLERAVNGAVDGNPKGFYFDEGYSIPKGSRAFRRILTQGRSLRTPAITLTQRPSWIDRFTWSEADFVQLFRLNNVDDRKVVQAWMPGNVDVHNPLPEFHSWYYDVGRNKAVQFSPVPSADEIESAIRARLSPHKRKRRFL